MKNFLSHHLSPHPLCLFFSMMHQRWEMDSGIIDRGMEDEIIFSPILMGLLGCASFFSHTNHRAENVHPPFEPWRDSISILPSDPSQGWVYNKKAASMMSLMSKSGWYTHTHFFLWAREKSRELEINWKYIKLKMSHTPNFQCADQISY